MKLLLSAPAILVFALASNNYLLWTSALSIGAVMYLDFVALFAILPEIFNNERIGLVTGIQNALASAAGFIFPFVFGFLKDATGAFELAWLWLVVMTLVGAALTLSLRGY